MNYYNGESGMRNKMKVKKKRDCLCIVLLIVILLYSSMSVEASKFKTVYVIDRVHETMTSSLNTSSVYEKDCRYYYNKSGLMIKLDGDDRTCYYKYDGTRLKKMVSRTGAGLSEIIFKYDKKGCLSSRISLSKSKTSVLNYKCDKYGRVTETTEGLNGDKNLYYYDKKGRMVKNIYINSRTDVSADNHRLITYYKYDNNGNIVCSSAKKDDFTSGYNWFFLYNKKGRPVKKEYDTYWAIEGATMETETSHHVENYHYKKMKISGEAVNIIKKQQWDIINDISE